MVNLLLIVLLVITALGESRGEESISNQLVRLQATYDTELDKIRTDTVRKREALLPQYEKSLGMLEQSAQKAGLLDKLLAVKKEKERFASAKQVAEADYCSAEPELLKMQQDHVARTTGLQLEQSRSIVSLADKFAASFGRLQTRLTQEGKVDDALAVKQKVTDLPKRPELSEARFIIAEAESRKPVAAAVQAKDQKPKEAAVKNPEPAAKPNPKDSEKAIRKRYEGYTDALIEGDLDKALRFMDPGFVRLAGPEQIKVFLVKIVPHLKGMKAAGIRLDAGRVEVNEEAGEGMNMPRFWTSNKWEYTDPTYWIRLDGEWYVDCRDRKKNKQEDGKQEL